MARPYEPDRPSDARIDPTRCRASVWAGWHDHQCRHKAVTEPDANGLRWCRQHSPEGEAAAKQRRAERADGINRRWRTQVAERDAERLYAALGRAAEPVLRALRRWLAEPEPWATPFGGGGAIEAIDAALAAFDGEQA